MANIYDQIINGTFSNPAMQTSGWGKPVGSPSPQYSRQGTSGAQFNPTAGFVPGAIPTDRLPQGTAGLPNPSPGSGLTPQQLSAMGGWSTNPLTGQLAYSQPTAGNPAEMAAAGQAAGMAPPIPASVDDRLNARNRALMAALPVGANPGMGGAMIGGGQMAPGIAPQGPPPAGIAPTVWAGDAPRPPSAPNFNNGTVQRATSTNGYIYGRGANGGWSLQGSGRSPGIGPAQQYAAANLMGQVNALNRQAAATGQAGGYNYVNGRKTGTVGGVSGSQAYSNANAAGRAAAEAKATKKPYKSSSGQSGDWFSSVTGS